MELTTWIYFAIACVGIAITPGPNSLLVLTHSVKFGPARAMYTIAGGVVAFFGLIALSMFGIGSLLKFAPSFLTYIQFLGGFYLLYLGLKQYTSPLNNISNDYTDKHIPRSVSLFIQGAVSAGSNPKVLIFFGAFLTQFIDENRNGISQFLIMALTFLVAEFLSEMSVNLIATWVRGFLQRHGKFFSYTCGTLFIIIGTVVIFH